MSAVSIPLELIGNRGRERGRLVDHELAAWTRSVREVLKRTDALLERLELLNLGGVVRPPRDLEAVARRLVQPFASAGDWTVQELLDGLLEAQEPILSELRACRAERVLRAGATHRSAKDERPPVTSGLSGPARSGPSSLPSNAGCTETGS